MSITKNDTRINLTKALSSISLQRNSSSSRQYVLRAPFRGARASRRCSATWPFGPVGRMATSNTGGIGSLYGIISVRSVFSYTFSSATLTASCTVRA